MFRRGSGKKPRSLVDRPSICRDLVPRSQEKASICFNPNGWYDENTDVREIDNYVVQHFRQEVESIPKLQTELGILERKYQQNLEKNNLRPIDQHKAKKQIQALQTKIQEYQSADRLNEYRERIRPFLNEWVELNNQESPYRRLGARKNFSPDKLSLVRNVVSIASDYSPLNLILAPTDEKGNCPHCRKPFFDDNGQLICEYCGIYQDYLIHDVDFGDKDRVNTGNKNDYISQETFDKAVINYQGKQQISFPRELFIKFDEHCRFHRISTQYLTQEKVRPIFKIIGFTSYYDHINLFLYEHLGKPLHDLSAHLDLINADYEIFSQVYDRVKEDARSSSLPAQYILYILLVRRGITCDKANFRLADTVEIRKDNDRMAEKVFQALQWVWQDTI